MFSLKCRYNFYFQTQSLKFPKHFSVMCMFHAQTIGHWKAVILRFMSVFGLSRCFRFDSKRFKWHPEVFCSHFFWYMDFKRTFWWGIVCRPNFTPGFRPFFWNKKTTSLARSFFVKKEGALQISIGNNSKYLNSGLHCCPKK